MPGPQVKNWKLYEQLRAAGHSKESAARIANSQAARLRKKRRRARMKRAAHS
jgi:hypothetical protein